MCELVIHSCCHPLPLTPAHYSAPPGSCVSSLQLGLAKSFSSSGNHQSRAQSMLKPAALDSFRGRSEYGVHSQSPVSCPHGSQTQLSRPAPYGLKRENVWNLVLPSEQHDYCEPKSSKSSCRHPRRQGICTRLLCQRFQFQFHPVLQYICCSDCHTLLLRSMVNAHLDLGKPSQTSSAFYSVGGSSQNWQPITELQLRDGDTSLFCIAANTVEYLNPVDDPFFLALYNDTTIFDSAGHTLKASNTIITYLSPGLPSTQCQMEAESWFQTSLAKIQGYAVEYAANTDNLGPFSSVFFPDMSLGRLSWEKQCKAQKINSVAGYQTFSLFGLIFTFVVGMAIIVLSVLLKLSISLVRRHLRGGLTRWKGERALVADGKFQLQRLVLQDRGLSVWHDGDKDIPWCETEAVIEGLKYASDEKMVYYEDVRAVRAEEPAKQESAEFDRV
ncbi:hypothetical protein NA57DRAFT_61448 [Rhizodiscina lignyota]|uniref:Uncharacterized protein n=1 Tax=Rhizodiscina lignyota TaxID=1504668 RepID=A0A9P4I1M4_9PEZI|nr:hypothetical protein NA57DRAFT_61448 [Rhizodiscina lignyota]